MTDRTPRSGWFTAGTNLNFRKRSLQQKGVAGDPVVTPVMEDSLPLLKKPHHVIRAAMFSHRDSAVRTGLLAMAAMAIVLWCELSTTKHHSVPTTYTPPGNTTNQLLATYEKIMSAADLTFTPGHDSFVALMLKDNKILCRRSHKEMIKKSRILAVVQMLRKGVETNNDNVQNNAASTNAILGKGVSSSSGLPILLIESDANGCHVHTQIDYLKFPRLTWSTPAAKYGHDWCAAIGATCYETWWAYHGKVASNSKRDALPWWLSWLFVYSSYSWDRTFQLNERKYPWHSKMNRAVWRGSTTYPFNIGTNFTDIPRAKMVRQSMDRPDLIDAGFTTFNQQFESREEELIAQKLTTSANKMPFDQQMKYRAILDIDGNYWSSRFAKLLCTNSIVIKIDPDWIEYFYDDVLPMKHYIPASLDNLTEVVTYVMDKNNDDEMKGIVKSANLWCQRTNTKDQLVKDMMSQLHKYEMAIHKSYNHSGWAEEWDSVQRRSLKYIGSDLEECNV